MMARLAGVFETKRASECVSLRDSYTPLSPSQHTILTRPLLTHALSRRRRKTTTSQHSRPSTYFTHTPSIHFRHAVKTLRSRSHPRRRPSFRPNPSSPPRRRRPQACRRSTQQNVTSFSFSRASSFWVSFCSSTFHYGSTTLRTGGQSTDPLNGRRTARRRASTASSSRMSRLASRLARGGLWLE